jgi:repressor LexA
MHTLTERQTDILCAIRAFRDREGYPPSLREIAVEVGLSSPSSVAYQLGELRKAGRVRWQDGVPRSYVLIDTKPVTQ